MIIKFTDEGDHVIITFENDGTVIHWSLYKTNISLLIGLIHAIKNDILFSLDYDIFKVKYDYDTLTFQYNDNFIIKLILNEDHLRNLEEILNKIL